MATLKRWNGTTWEPVGSDTYAVLSALTLVVGALACVGHIVQAVEVVDRYPCFGFGVD